MNNSRLVLVTGGAGFIGSHLVDKLVDSGFKVRVLDNLSSGKIDNLLSHLSAEKIEFVNGDIRDISVVRKCVAGVHAVVHLAAIISVPFSVQHPDLTFDVNVGGTLNLLRSCVTEGVSKFVFASSCAVYGNAESMPICEETGTNPVSPYAESKLAAERYCLGFGNRGLLESVVLRFFNVYGSRQTMNDYSGVITRFVNFSKQGLPLVIYGDGCQTRDFVNVHDITDAITLSVKLREPSPNIFNIGFGEATSINDLAIAVSKVAKSKLIINYQEQRIGDIKESFGDISRAKSYLGYTPKVSLTKGLGSLFE